MARVIPSSQKSQPLLLDRQHQLTLEILISFLKPGSLPCDSDNDSAICHITDPFPWFIYNLIVGSIWSNMSGLKPFALKITHLSPFIPCIVAGIAWKFSWCQPKSAVWLITKWLIREETTGLDGKSWWKMDLGEDHETQTFSFSLLVEWELDLQEDGGKAMGWDSHSPVIQYRDMSEEQDFSLINTL